MGFYMEVLILGVHVGIILVTMYTCTCRHCGASLEVSYSCLVVIHSMPTRVLILRLACTCPRHHTIHWPGRTYMYICAAELATWDVGPDVSIDINISTDPLVRACRCIYICNRCRNHSSPYACTKSLTLKGIYKKS